MQVGAVSYTTDTGQQRRPIASVPVPNLQADMASAEPAARYEVVKVRADLMGLGQSLNDDGKSVQASWQKLQSIKAGEVAKSGEEQQAKLDMSGSAADDLRTIAQAAAAGDAAAVLAAQMRLAEHYLKL